MPTNTTDANESIDLEPGETRALTEYLTVLEDVGCVRGAADLFLVVSQSGTEYLVDARDGVCECPDAVLSGRRQRVRLKLNSGLYGFVYGVRGVVYEELEELTVDEPDVEPPLVATAIDGGSGRRRGAV